MYCSQQPKQLENNKNNNQNNKNNNQNNKNNIIIK